MQKNPVTHGRGGKMCIRQRVIRNLDRAQAKATGSCKTLSTFPDRRGIRANALGRIALDFSQLPILIEFLP
jgi:hypothetical protein